MTFLQIRYFHTVVVRGSVTSAAEALQVSPASVSKVVRQLEKELGVELFTRVGRSIAPNEYGKVFFEHASEMLDSMDLAKARLANLRHGKGRTVRVRFDQQFIDLGRLPIDVKQQRPDMNLVIIPPHAKGQPYDLRFFFTDDQVNDSSTTLICEEPLVLAVAADHPLARRPKVRLGQLKDEPFVIWQGNRQDEVVFNACEAAGFAPDVSLVLNAESASGLYDAVREGIGCTLVFGNAWSDSRDPDEVALVPISDVIRKRHVYVALPEGHVPSDDEGYLISYVREKLHPIEEGA